MCNNVTLLSDIQLISYIQDFLASEKYILEMQRFLEDNILKYVIFKYNLFVAFIHAQNFLIFYLFPSEIGTSGTEGS